MDHIIEDDYSLITRGIENISPNTYTISFTNQAHTFGNLISERLRKNTNIVVCNYKVVPLSKELWFIYVQTKPNVIFKEELIKAVNDILLDVQQVKAAIMQSQSR